jgi:hypothetical protein
MCLLISRDCLLRPFTGIVSFVRHLFTHRAPVWLSLGHPRKAQGMCLLLCRCLIPTVDSVCRQIQIF